VGRLASHAACDRRLGRWETGTVAFWDSGATQHDAVCDSFPRRRVMARVVIKGDRPL
jgi:alpha-ketoglutarate-dependent taurine dioxygenase